VNVAIQVKKRAWKIFIQSRKALVSHNHGFAWVNRGAFDGLLDGFTIELQDFAVGETTLSYTSSRQSSNNPARDWIFSPIRRASTEAGEMHVTDGCNIRLDEVAVVAIHLPVT
jgi:hypothetical protein